MLVVDFYFLGLVCKIHLWEWFQIIFTPIYVSACTFSNKRDLPGRTLSTGRPVHVQKVSHVKAGWALVIAGWLQYDWRGLSHEFVKVEGPDLCFDGDCCQTSRVMHYLSFFLRCPSLSHSLFSLMAHPECPVYVFFFC